MKVKRKNIDDIFIPIIITLKSKTELHQLRHCLEHYNPMALHKEIPVDEFRQNLLTKLTKI